MTAALNPPGLPVAGAVTVVVGAALSGAAVALLTAGSWRTALRILLDLLTAAGLLRLTGARGWADLAGVAAIVALRQVLWAALTPDRPADAGSRDDARRPAPERITPYGG